MDNQDKLRLTRNWGTLTSDLDDKDIVHHLIQDGILTLDDVDEIKSKGYRRACVDELLTKLMRKGPQAYTSFKRALQTQYPWLAQQLDTTNVNEAVHTATAGLDGISGQTLGQLHCIPEH